MLGLAPGLIVAPAIAAPARAALPVTDFAKATPDNAIIYMTVQSTASSQVANLKILGSILGPLTQKAVSSAGSSASSITQLTSTFGRFFNGEYGVAVLPVTTSTSATGKTVPHVHLLLDLGLESGVTADQLRGTLGLLGLQSKPSGSYRGLSVAQIDLNSLLAATGTAGAGLSKDSALSGLFYNAVIGNNAVMASDLPSLKAAIDTSAGAHPSITAGSVYKRTAGTLSPSHFMSLFVNIDTKMLAQVTSAVGTSGTGSITGKPGTLGVGVTVSAEADGIQVRTSPTVATGSLATTTLMSSTPNSGINLLPADALLYGSINNPAALIRLGITTAFQSAFASTGKVPANTPKQDPIATINKMTGLNIDQDVLSWMHGELSFALLPVGAKAYGKDNPLTDISLVAALKVQNQSFVQGKLNKIFSAINKKATKPADKARFVDVAGPGGQKLHILLDTPNGTGYTFSKGYLFVATALPADIASVADAGGKTVSTSPAYQAALAHFGHGPFGGVVFIDVTKLRATLEQYAAASGTNMTTYNQAAKPIVSIFKSVAAVSNAGPNGGGAIFIGISR